MRKILAFIIIILIITTCGCNSVKENKKTKETKASDYEISIEMIDFIKDKYKDYVFEQVDFIRAGFDYGYDFLTLDTTIDDEVITFYVKRRENDLGEVNISDNLFGTIIKNDYEEMLKNTLDTYFNDYHIVSHLDLVDYPNSLTNNSTLDDLLSLKDEIEESVIITIFIKEDVNNNSNFTEIAHNCFNKLEKRGIKTLYNFICVKEENYNKYKENGFIDKSEEIINKESILEQCKIRSK